MLKKLNKNSWMILFISFIGFINFITCQQVFALAIDEKLPLRILKSSDTKKTVLINRGVEDGLVVGDHAKFFLTTGVVARGVVVKTSPSRSVWALYSLTNKDEIDVDKVMNLKIATAVKLTDDVTKMLSDDENTLKAPEGVVLAEGADDLDKDLTSEENSELAQLDNNSKSDNKNKNQVQTTQLNAESLISRKTLEMWGMFHVSSMTTANSQGAEGEGSQGKSKNLDVLAGLEKYFLTYDSWYGRFSLYPLIHYASQEYTSVQGNSVSSSVFAYGAGVNWHFLAPPLSIERMIGFIGGSYGIGSSTDASAQTTDLGEDTSNNENGDLQGRVTFFSIGGGIKYYLNWGLGLKIIFDYYQRVESYAIQDSADDYSKTVKGPRVLLGLSYRF